MRRTPLSLLAYALKFSNKTCVYEQEGEETVVKNSQWEILR